MRRWRSGQSHQTVNLAALGLRRFESFPAHTLPKSEHGSGFVAMCSDREGFEGEHARVPSVDGNVRAWSGGEMFRRKHFERLTESFPAHNIKNTRHASGVFYISLES